MAKKSTRYLIITILIVAVFIVLLLILKDQQTSEPAVTESETQEQRDDSQQEDKLPPPERKILRDYLPSSPNQQIVKWENFTLSYVEEHEQAEWVAYELTDVEVQGAAERSDDFREDPQVRTGSASLNDYYRSGYDRGHLAPAGDMKFSDNAMSESFYMSNMSPQEPSFNRGIWRELEEEVRELAVDNGRLFVVTGPVFGKRNRRIGDNRVSIPRAFYKVLLDYNEPEIKAIAFLLANEGSKKDIYDFVVTIDSVEAVTGIDFFPALPDLEENKLESMSDPSLWIGDE